VVAVVADAADHERGNLILGRGKRDALAGWISIAQAARSGKTMASAAWRGRIMVLSKLAPSINTAALRGIVEATHSTTSAVKQPICQNDLTKP
jgi:DNA transposition AAA+ family ATPase